MKVTNMTELEIETPIHMMEPIKDSMFNVAMEEKCQSLRERVLQWRRESQDTA